MAAAAAAAGGMICMPYARAGSRGGGKRGGRVPTAANYDDAATRTAEAAKGDADADADAAEATRTAEAANADADADADAAAAGCGGDGNALLARTLLAAAFHARCCV